MNKFPLQTTIVYDNKSSSNPSLITAGFPSSSIMTSRLIQPSSTTKQNYYLNQNRATDTQPMSLNSQKTSDIYLNLSRKDIDDLMTALHTLVQHVYQSSSSYILDQFICIDQNEPISNIQMLPQQAHSLQIHDQINFNKIDVATQWSLQILAPTSSTDILTELSQSKTTITTNNSAVHTPLISKVHSFMDTSSISLNKKKIKRTSIKLVSKRPHYKSSKRFRPHHHSQSNNRLMTIIQSLKTTDLQEDSSFDFFDIDTTFSDI